VYLHVFLTGLMACRFRFSCVFFLVVSPMSLVGMSNGAVAKLWLLLSPPPFAIPCLSHCGYGAGEHLCPLPASQRVLVMFRKSVHSVDCCVTQFYFSFFVMPDLCGNFFIK